MVVIVPLTQGKAAVIDDEDAARVLAYKWSAYTSRGKWYARRSISGADGKPRHLQLHRFIASAPQGTGVDHVDGDGLNNRRSNLRLSSHAQNGANQRRPKNNTSGYKGVHRAEGRWAAKVGSTYLGVYATPEEAARAYDTAAREIYGDFARLNFPDEQIVVARRVGGPAHNSTSGVRGVVFNKQAGKWTARMRHQGRRLFVGYYATAEDAAQAIKAKARALSGEAT